MRRKGVLAVYSAVPAALACSTSSFDPLYQAYPDCAVACLACPDADYLRNFANNCDYTSGDCCKTQYHNIIAATWACVRSPSTGCGPAAAQPGVLQGDADVKVTYRRQTSTLSLSGYHNTVETFEVARDRGGARGIAAVAEEVD